MKYRAVLQNVIKGKETMTSYWFSKKEDAEKAGEEGLSVFGGSHYIIETDYENELLNQILPSGSEIIKYGALHEKLLLEVKMTTSLFNYIDIVTNYYDDEEKPFFNNWTDIEGMGYGWVWLNYEEEDWHKMMGRLVTMETEVLLREMEDTLYFIYLHEGMKIYHFIYLDSKNYRKDVLIRFSDAEINW